MGNPVNTATGNVRLQVDAVDGSELAPRPRQGFYSRHNIEIDRKLDKFEEKKLLRGVHIKHIRGKAKA